MDVIKFLSRGKTTKQIIEKFGTDDILDRNYNGYDHFTQKSINGDIVHILIENIPNDIVVNDKNFSYHIGKDEKGINQPYIMVQLPSFSAFEHNFITVAPLFDVHYGHSQFKYEDYNAYIKWIKETDNVYVIMGGDLMENALDDGKGYSYEQNINPETQLNDLIRMLAPVAHKVLCAVPGNHENRTYKKTGLDPMAILCDTLKIPYFNGPVYMSLLSDSHKWKFYVFHGKSAAGTKGGRINAGSKPKIYTDFINFFVSGHVHESIISKDLCVCEDPVNARLEYKEQYTVVTGAFVGWQGTYAYREGYSPAVNNKPVCNLYSNGHYDASEITT